MLRYVSLGNRNTYILYDTMLLPQDAKCYHMITGEKLQIGSRLLEREVANEAVVGHHLPSFNRRRKNGFWYFTKLQQQCNKGFPDSHHKNLGGWFLGVWCSVSVMLSRSLFFPSSALPPSVCCLWILLFVVSWFHDDQHGTRYQVFTTASQVGKEKSGRSFP